MLGMDGTDAEDTEDGVEDDGDGVRLSEGGGASSRFKSRFPPPARLRGVNDRGALGLLWPCT